MEDCVKVGIYFFVVFCLQVLEKAGRAPIGGDAWQLSSQANRKICKVAFQDRVSRMVICFSLPTRLRFRLMLLIFPL